VNPRENQKKKGKFKKEIGKKKKKKKRDRQDGFLVKSARILLTEEK
jgi:hypothetical protein